MHETSHICGCEFPTAGHDGMLAALPFVMLTAQIRSRGELSHLDGLIPVSLYAGIAEVLEGTAVGRAGRRDGAAAQGAQDDADDERGGG